MECGSAFQLSIKACDGGWRYLWPYLGAATDAVSLCRTFAAFF